MGSAQSGRHRSHFDVESVCDRAVIEISEVAKEDDLALTLRQFGDPTPDRRIGLSSAAPVGREFDVTVRRSRATRAPRRGASGVDHDLPQPRFKRCFAAVGGT